jgi:excisionase family DNA binding protein
MAEDEMLTYHAVSELLGIKLGTLYSMVARKEIPHVRLGPRLIRFRRSELDAWIRERSVAASA